MTSAIFGASGDIGRNLLTPLLRELGPVLPVSRQSSPADLAAAWSADVIWLSIPRDAIPALLENVSLQPHQLVVDICSIKRRLSPVIHRTGAAHLSLHMLNGPLVPLEGQKWVHIFTSQADAQHAQAQVILDFLKKKKIHFLAAAAEDDHDFMMGVVLSIPELATIVIDQMITDYAQDCGRAKPSLHTMMEWAVPASNAMYNAVIHSIASSALWLRRDLITKAHGALVASAKKSFQTLQQMDDAQIGQIIERQEQEILSVPMSDRKRVKSWIERWFADSNQYLLSFQKKKQTKPKLTIQEQQPTDIVLPVSKGRVTVGIHGIEGCFTHEALLRLCEELQVDSSQLDLKYLVEAQAVIEAVVNGQTDRGVFAFANSGSGAYVSSMHAMGAYQYDVVAIMGMAIMQCLMAHPDIKSIDQVTEVFGHPQAVSQCKRTFAEKYPQLKLTAGQDSDDTALCAKRIAEGDLPIGTATLASQVAAQRYGLHILEYGMHHDPFNTTTFLVVKKKA